MSDFTHCGHGKTYEETCKECDEVWHQQVTVPAFRRDIATLLRFYGAQTVQALVIEQMRHVEKLQAKLTPETDRSIRKVREG